MPQIRPVDLEPTHIIHMYELMRDRALHMLLAKKVAGAQHNGAWVGNKAASVGQVARSTDDISRREGAVGDYEVFEEEDQKRALQSCQTSVRILFFFR